MSISTTTTTDQFLSTPGEILKEEFLEPLGISNYRLAKTIGVGGNRNRRNRSRQANHQHGYGIPSGGSAWHHSGILDEPAARLRLAQIRHQYPRRYQTSDSRVSLRDNVMTRPLTIALLQISPDRHAGRQTWPKASWPAAVPRNSARDIALFPEMWSNGYALHGRPVEDWTAEAVDVGRRLRQRVRRAGPRAEHGDRRDAPGTARGRPRATPWCSSTGFGERRLVYAKVHTCDFDVERHLIPGARVPGMRARHPPSVPCASAR